MRTDFTHFSVFKTVNPILNKKCTIQKLFFVVLVFCTLIATNTFANPVNFRGEFNSWGTTVLAQKGAIMECRIQETATSAGRHFKFDNNGSWGSSWGAGATITKNSKFTAYNNGTDGLYASTIGNYYTFIIQNIANGSNASASVLETTYNPRTINTVTRDITAPSSQIVTVSATLSATLQTGEYCYLRYTTDSWATSSVVAMTTGANPYTATIPAQAVGKNIIYYCFTSNQSTISTAADADYFTLEMGNNNNLNYNYTVAAATTPTLTSATGATVDAAFDVTFTDDAAWRAAITGITVDASTLASGAYSTSSGKITFTPSVSTLLQSSGSKTIVVSATGYTNASVTQIIGVGAAAKLAITTQPTAPTTNGGVLAVEPVVVVQDKYGNLTSSTASILAAKADAGTWTLGGTATVAATSGTATFSGLTATSAAAVTGATITFTSGSLTSVTSNAFNIPSPPTQIDWVNLQYPGSGTISLSAPYVVYAQVYKAGLTPGAGQGAGIKCWIGYNSTNTDPSTWSESSWNLAAYNSTAQGNNDEYKLDIGSIIPSVGTYYYASRFQIGALSYLYGGFSSGFWNGTSNVSGSLVVSQTTNTTAPTQSSITINSINGAINAQFNGKAQIELYNLTGELIKSVYVENHFIQNVNKGIYFLRINGQTHKVLVQ